MLRHKRNLILDVFDYSGNKKCTLYDSGSDASGQAHDVIVATERNGWKELSFTIPSVCEDMNGNQEQNFRLQFLIADYKIRLIDDEGTDWYLISEPKITHNKLAKTVNVNAGHVSQLLKTKNLGLEFSDNEGNNVGTAAQLLDTILDGTGWKAGYVADFKEKYTGKTKYRTLKASAKTGAFKLIASMCDLFEAKPIYHGDEKTVDIIPMNPFSEPVDGGLPDIADENKSKVLEMRYGTNLKNVQRTQDTENIVTKLYAYGAYGDKTSGYCGIDEWHHTEYTLTANNNIPAGTECWFEILNEDTQINYKRYFKATEQIASGTKLLWSTLDPASMSYVLNLTTNKAYGLTYERQLDTIPVEITLTSSETKENVFSFVMDFDYYREIGLLTEPMLQTIATYQHRMPALMKESQAAAADFAESLGELSEVVGSVNFCKLSLTQYENNDGYLKLKLNVIKDEEQPESAENGYKKGIIYRTDYNVPDRKQFKWYKTDKIKENGDPLNEAASMIYILHNTDPVTWETAYVKEIEYETGSDGEPDEDKPLSLTLWMEYSDITPGLLSYDKIYLFQSNTINGRLGAYQVADEAAVSALEATTKVVTVKHPVYFSETKPVPQPETEPLVPSPDWAKEIKGYSWWWKYGDGIPSEMYFWYKDDGDTDWNRVFYGSEQPAGFINDNEYFFNWQTSKLYKRVNGEVVEYSGRSSAEDRIVAKFGSIFRSCLQRDQYYKGIYQYYTVVLNAPLTPGNWALTDPYGTYYVFTNEETIPAGMKLVYDTTQRWIIATDEDVDPSTLNVEDIIDQTIEVKDYRYDNVSYHAANIIANTVWEQGDFSVIPVTPDPINPQKPEAEDTGEWNSGFCAVYPNVVYHIDNLPIPTIDVYYYTIARELISNETINYGETFTTPNNTKFVRFIIQADESLKDQFAANGMVYADAQDTAFIADNEEYIILPDVATGSGELKGIIALTGKFGTVSDETYLVKYQRMKQAQEDVKTLEDRLVEELGDIYREGYWQKKDYVDGDEEKLYNDALENLEEIAFPEAKYSISYLDLYTANEHDIAYGVTEHSSLILWPDITADYAVHLIDEEIGINKWAFIDKLNKCYDMPWKTTLSINTKLSTIAQHSFADVMTNIAQVANEVKGKMEMYDRSDAFNDNGMMRANLLEGAIDANKLLITGGSSTWFTDDKGNLMFLSADGKSAMALTGNGFAIANSKDEWGEWNWRTFGTGDGFTADEIIAGTISADRIGANSITANKLASDAGNDLILTSNKSIQLMVSSASEQTKEDMREEMDDMIGYRLEIISTSDVLSDDIPVTLLRARVWHGSKIVTEDIDASRFAWTRVSSDSAADTLWNREHKGMKQITLTKADVYYSATYSCELSEQGEG